MRFILFDIDGTLIDSGGAGTRALNLSFREQFGIKDASYGVSMAGKTDIEIMKTILDEHSLPDTDGALGRLIDSYLKHLYIEINNKARHMKPGVKIVLETLSKDNGFKLGLLTGNLEAGARIKLKPFGLNRYFPLGAFGSDNIDRNKLLPLAIERFKNTYGRSINYNDCIVVGDTPRDVLCAKPYGALCIAVATGPYSVEELKAACADLILKDMTDINRFINFIAD